MSTFAQFPRWAEQNRSRIEGKAAIMFCTGGVRCEKASALLKALGAKEAFHLSGGIHRYVETFGDSGLYQGKNFVFDRRVALGAEDTMARGAGSAKDEKGTASGSSTVPFGRCIECQCPWEKLTGRMVCEVCRELALCCDSCSGNDSGVVLCDDHRYLRGHYYWHLDRFSPEELALQCDALATLARRMDAQSEEESAKARAARKTEKTRRAAAAKEQATSGSGSTIQPDSIVTSEDGPPEAATASDAGGPIRVIGQLSAAAGGHSSALSEEQPAIASAGEGISPPVAAGRSDPAAV